MAGLILPGEDVHDVARAVQQGDPTVGWRGDPGMDVYRGSDGSVAVYAFDAHGNRYRACVVSTRYPGWRHELLRSLRDGDPYRVDAFEEAMEHNRRVNAERDKAAAAVREEADEKLAWAIRRDLGKREFY